MRTTQPARLRRGLARHRPRPAPAHRHADLRPTDVVLALAGLALLGAFALWAALILASRALAP
ncbi:hypothetical protein [Methylobacterium isbiliense]|jgi:hypothetical protein|uniref:Uncharacterized protein n=1 Tax=Methylobacterium isbiliense TaxID=315478 RepID=A0ABQ4SI38_9HYPH|nr:hypothetical protein [Methylobacterium isbiliense]MDN3623954.1 hypothetical protein [Methylobacterium isbiliense]GJE02807.1 hypothetical protein GMJLKIPL_4756 [Methylobacterium isbiliense]